MTGFIYYLAALGAILSGSAFLPSLVAFGAGETELGIRILLYSLLGGFFCVSILLAIAGRPVGIERRSAALLVVVSWLLFPILVAVPLADLAELSFTQAWFQSVSSFTTTGSLVFGNLESVPKSIIFLLAQLQWLGGLATLITFILVLSPWEIGGLPKIGSVSETTSIIASEYRLVKFCGRLFRAMLGLTILCFVFLLLAGVPAYESIVLSFSALSTGGISPINEGLDLLLKDAGMIIMSVFFIIGATSVFWHRQLFNLRFSELVSHRESYFALVVWLLLAVVIANQLALVSGKTLSLFDTRTLSEGLMNAASVVSTSGMQTRPGVYTLLAPSLILILIVIGAGCFSTAGGIKLYRIGLVFSHSQDELNRLIFPSSVPSRKFGGTKLNVEFMKGIWAFFSIWILTIGVFSFMMSVTGLDFQAAFTAIVAASSNAGPVYGSVWDLTDSLAWPDYFEMNNIQLIILSFAMILGRLEIVVLFASVMLLFQNVR